MEGNRTSWFICMFYPHGKDAKFPLNSSNPNYAQRFAFTGDTPDIVPLLYNVAAAKYNYKYPVNQFMIVQKQGFSLFLTLTLV